MYLQGSFFIIWTVYSVLSLSGFWLVSSVTDSSVCVDGLVSLSLLELESSLSSLVFSGEGCMAWVAAAMAALIFSSASTSSLV